MCAWVCVVQDIFNTLHQDVPPQVCFVAGDVTLQCACSTFSVVFLFCLGHKMKCKNQG